MRSVPGRREDFYERLAPDAALSRFPGGTVQYAVSPGAIRYRARRLRFLRAPRGRGGSTCSMSPIRA